MRVHYIPVPDVRAKIAIGSRTFLGWSCRDGTVFLRHITQQHAPRASKGAREGAERERESTLPDKWLASPCCVPPHRRTQPPSQHRGKRQRPFNCHSTTHLDSTRPRFQTTWLNPSRFPIEVCEWGGKHCQFVCEKVDRNENYFPSGGV